MTVFKRGSDLKIEILREEVVRGNTLIPIKSFSRGNSNALISDSMAGARFYEKLYLPIKSLRNHTILTNKFDFRPLCT